MRTTVLTALALTAFAGNSILCRLALRAGSIDAATFSSVRLASGAAMLLLVAALTGRARTGGMASRWSAGLLFLYAVPFSLAYVTLSTGTGALILFGSVQITMLGAALAGGERPTGRQWLGVGAALAGLVFLLLPGLDAPSQTGALLMAVAGCAWGWYSLRGRRSSDPLAQTTGNFVGAVPLALVVNALAWQQFHVEARGLSLAVASGAVTSGLGYVVWYTALRGLTATRAAVIQLATPVLTAAGGVLLLAEGVSTRLLVATPLVLGGIALTLAGRQRRG